MIQAQMTLFAASLLTLLVPLSAPMADSGRIVPADPWEIIHIAREFGTAEVGRDGMREPKITGKIGEIAYEIGFYGCYLGRDCTSVLFQARLAREDWEPDSEEIADWNREKLFGRAWVDGDSQAVLDHPVAMAGGLPAKSLESTFLAWQLSLDEFVDYVDF